MKSRLLAIGLCLLVSVTGIVSACGGDDEESTTPEATSPSPTTTAATTPPETTTPTSTTPITGTAAVDQLTELCNKWTGMEPVRYDLVVTLPDQPDKITGHIWQTYNKQRVEYVVEGESLVMIYLLDEDIMYTYYPEQNLAMKMPLDLSQAPQGTQVGDMVEILENSPSIVGKEIKDGVECMVISFVTGGETEVTLWIWIDTGFPIRTEGKNPDGTLTIMEFKNIDFSDIPDSMFEIPEGVQIAET